MVPLYLSKTTVEPITVLLNFQTIMYYIMYILDCISFLTLYEHIVSAVERNVHVCNSLFRIVMLILVCGTT
jgi:hypothetical protein